MALLFAHSEAKIAHHEIEEDINRQGDGNVLCVGEQEPRDEEVRDKKTDCDSQKGSDDDLERYLPELLLDLYDKIAENEAHGRTQKAVQGTTEHLTYDKVTGDGRYRYKDDL